MQDWSGIISSSTWSLTLIFFPRKFPAKKSFNIFLLEQKTKKKWAVFDFSQMLRRVASGQFKTITVSCKRRCASHLHRNQSQVQCEASATSEPPSQRALIGWNIHVPQGLNGFCECLWCQTTYSAVIQYRFINPTRREVVRCKGALGRIHTSKILWFTFFGLD